MSFYSDSGFIADCCLTCSEYDPERMRVKNKLRCISDCEKQEWGDAYAKHMEKFLNENHF